MEPELRINCDRPQVRVGAVGARNVGLLQDHRLDAKTVVRKLQICFNTAREPITASDSYIPAVGQAIADLSDERRNTRARIEIEMTFVRLFPPGYRHWH